MGNIGAACRNKYDAICIRDGKVVWSEEVYNIVVNQGLDNILNTYFKGSGYTAAHFVGLKGAGAIAAADTLSAKAWGELTGYSGDRKPLVLGAVASQGVDNSAEKATFNITASATVAGCFVATTASGNSGVLYSVVDFAQARPVVSGDMIIVTCLFTQRSV